MLVSPKIGVAMLPRSPAWLSFSSQERITWVQRKSPTIHNYPTSDVTGIGWNGSYRTIVSKILTKHCCHKTVGRKESEAWTPHLAPCSTWTKIWRFLSDLCLVSQNKIWRFLFGIYRKRGRNQTWSGLKCPPAARQFSLVFPTAWTWNPWSPVSSPATLPWIRMCAPKPPIMLGHWGRLGVFFKKIFQSLPAQCTGCQIPRCWTPDQLEHLWSQSPQAHELSLAIHGHTDHDGTHMARIEHLQPISPKK